MTNNQTIKVLIAEDEEVLRRMYLTRFKAEKFQVFEAVNGKEAFELAKEKKPDIIMLDIIMPLVDGFAALRKIKADETTKNIPVVMLTNLAQNGDITEGKRLGATDYLVKANLTPTEVVEKIKKVLKR